MAASKRVFTGVGMLPDLPPVATSNGVLTDVQVTSIIDTIRQLLRTVNGQLTFGDGAHSSQSGNIDGHTKEVLFSQANVDYEVPHGLGRLPIGIIVLYVDTDDAFVRASNRGSWNTTRLFVRCRIAGATALFIIV